MNVWKRALVHVALSSLGWSSLLMVLPGIALPASAQQTATQAAIESSAASQALQQNIPVANAGNYSKAGELPDSPGAMLAQAAQQSASQPRLMAPSSSGSSPSASPEGQAQSTPQKPVGTAAAEAPNATGVAASQPAGVAIAPAKQHRVRTIVLRTGAIIGAGVAVGSVVALTAATPSKPPGAH
jgi:hypothetical protein